MLLDFRFRLTLLRLWAALGCVTQMPRHSVAFDDKNIYQIQGFIDLIGRFRRESW